MRDLSAELAARIVEHVANESMVAGDHLPAQALADCLRVSRSPINRALQLLANKGVLRHKPNRGFFLGDRPVTSAAALGLVRRTDLSRVYFAIAEDHLAGRLEDQASERELRQRYGLTRAQLSELLNRLTREGWAERRPGYGWTFSPILRTAASLDQTYRLRLAIEPAALLEPGFQLPRKVMDKAIEVERGLLAGAIDRMSADDLFERGSRFHEMLAEASGNPFFIDTLRRVNRIRRLLAYRAMTDRSRYYPQVRQHLAILDLLRRERNEEAAASMRVHLQAVVRNLKQLGRFDGKPRK